MSVDHEFWSGKNVLVTGHTGFKGGWLSLWLAEMGASVTGLALDPPTEPSFYSVTNLGTRLAADLRCDIRDIENLRRAVSKAAPEIVLHLAAQPLVRHSYVDPVETYATNVMGTVHLFEAVRATPTVKAVVNVTTDKCYENREWVWSYRENEAMGGHDPYSNSKGCSELVTVAYRRAFLAAQNKHVGSARAGNVIGGGDWATDRLLPDFMRAIDAGETLVIRSPSATRPWQHVLDCVSGYLVLAQALWNGGEMYAEGWNFGPDEGDVRTVQWIVERLCRLQPGTHWRLDDRLHPHEATLLMLSNAKAKAILGWRPRWNLPAALTMTLNWHVAWRQGEDMSAVSLSQIEAYQRGASDAESF